MKRRILTRFLVSFALTMMALILPSAHVTATAPGRSVIAPACPDMKASPVAWVTINQEGRAEKQVDSYPADINYLAVVFEVNCMPRNTTLSVVWAREESTIFSRRFTPKPLLSRGRIMDYVATTDESPIGEGQYSVTFLLNKKVLTQGEITVGDVEAPQADDVFVTGQVKDRDTNRPIAGVMIYVSKAGIAADDYFGNDMPTEDTLTTATTDSQGRFRLKAGVKMKQSYAIIFTAQGYRPDGDDFMFEESAALLRITLAKTNR